MVTYKININMSFPLYMYYFVISGDTRSNLPFFQNLRNFISGNKEKKKSILQNIFLSVPRALKLFSLKIKHV